MAEYLDSSPTGVARAAEATPGVTTTLTIRAKTARTTRRAVVTILSTIVLKTRKRPGAAPLSPTMPLSGFSQSKQRVSETSSGSHLRAVHGRRQRVARAGSGQAYSRGGRIQAGPSISVTAKLLCTAQFS